jgi:uncharacterized repeat protein (TIGR02543 family)
MKRKVKSLLLLSLTSLMLVGCGNKSTSTYDDMFDNISSAQESSSSKVSTSKDAISSSISTSEETKFVVTFNSDGGTSVASQNVKEGEKVTRPSDPTLENAEFVGWFITGETEEYDFNTPVTSNIELTAKWNYSYSVTFVVNGGTSVETQIVKEGEKATRPSDPIKEGYSFGGWYLSNQYLEEFDFETTITMNYELFAKWNDDQIAPQPNTFSVIFDADGGTSIESQTVNENEKATCPSAPEKEGYTFDGWYLDGENEEFNFETLITSNITLKAKWVIAQKQYTSYYLTGTFTNWTNKEEYNMYKSSKSSNTDKAIILGVQLRKNASLKITDGTSWYGYNDSLSNIATSGEGENIVLNESGTYNIYLNENYEVWIEKVGDYTLVDTYYTVTFNSNEGSNVNSQSVLEGEKAIKPSNPTKDNYEFVGWFLEGETEAYDFNTPITSNIELIAKWNRIYTITFNSNGGSEVETQSIIENNKASTPINPVKDNYNFIAWYTDEDLTIEYDFETEVTSDIILYAKWEEKSSTSPVTYRVTFNTDGGSNVSPQDIEENGIATCPSNPTKDGYTFVYWYIEGETEAYDFNAPVTSNIELKAKWEEAKEYVNYWLVGSFTNWTNDDTYKMYKNPNASSTDKGVLLNVTLNQGDELKVHDDSSTWVGYRDELSNVVSNNNGNVVINETGTYNIYLNEYNQLWIEKVS